MDPAASDMRLALAHLRERVRVAPRVASSDHDSRVAIVPRLACSFTRRSQYGMHTLIYWSFVVSHRAVKETLAGYSI